MHKQLNQKQALKYNRQILLPGFDLEAQEALLNASVLMIGVGGLGNSAAQYLVSSGIGALTLCDDDKVELSNLSRQTLFIEQDIGRKKAQAAIARLSDLNPDGRLQFHTRRFDDSELAAQIRAHDLVLDCTDNLSSRNQINRHCVALGKPLVVGAAIRFEGQLFSYAPEHNAPCYQCLSALFTEPQQSCVESGILTPVVAIVGAMQALEAIKLITGVGKARPGRLQLFDGLSGEWRYMNVKRHALCPACGPSKQK
ncbi:molybdopterin-synthase adenylyltransferase MoeB [Aliiglaciecola sp. CAU 1673]|uniref:HesA/MoeB/ThiF family protein n=1 Tax=Aliiglaciecola sp. CAU 1673 TaxID=3032595 RepID=UPI0023DC5F56|nr:molybdopterin-synthase adenylyltransferase MoeB [Aliiglaciecola sp. CAU 1673]MDF2177033.1 molybdopterin-synthase adenylyltransferase MoeB [Aliiglaciecola sp. CAU 1673]